MTPSQTSAVTALGATSLVMLEKISYLAAFSALPSEIIPSFLPPFVSPISPISLTAFKLRLEKSFSLTKQCSSNVKVALIIWDRTWPRALG